jgi:ADP-ribosyl-[dinitrogen reductase] hydrolase
MNDPRQDRAVGALLGLAVGDAVGTTLEFSTRESKPPLVDMVGGGPFGLKPGQWTDDTSMALCLADSLLACERLDQRDLMQRFCRWYRHGENSSTGICFDIGNTTRHALERFEHTGNPVAGSTDSHSAGNGSLMRLAPVAIFRHSDRAAAEEIARGQSVITHGAAAAVEACTFLVHLLIAAIEGASKEAVLRPRPWSANEDVDRIARGTWRTKSRAEIRSSGYVIDTLEAALWSLEQSGSFRQAVLTAANLGDDADTVAAVTGQLAGAIWGRKGIPAEWMAGLAMGDRIRDLAIRLFEIGMMRAGQSSRYADSSAARSTPSHQEKSATDNMPSQASLTERQQALRELARDGVVHMTWAPEVMEEPAPIADRRRCADRVRGMLLGLAIGDALGNTTEGMLPHARYAQYGEIRDYLPNKHADNRVVGLPSDDTQLAFWLLEHLLERRRIEPDALAALFCSQRIFGIGRTMRAFVRQWETTRDWRRSAQASAGNGALMRIASVVVLHIADGSPDLWVDAALGTAVTHNDRAAIASSIAFVGMLAELLTLNTMPAREWWIDAFVRRARPIEGDKTVYEPRSVARVAAGPLWKLVDVDLRHSLHLRPLEADAEWYSGAYLIETVPAALRILTFHAADPEEAIVRAVNDTKDNDTIAAIVGAAVGALHGAAALPRRWREGLLGRVVADIDDRKVLRLLDRAVDGLDQQLSRSSA